MQRHIIHLLGNPVRVQLLCCLTNGAKNVQDLVHVCGLAQSAVSQHLAKLRKGGVVQAERSGRYIYYRLSDKRFGQLATILKDIDREAN